MHPSIHTSIKILSVKRYGKLFHKLQRIMVIAVRLIILKDEKVTVQSKQSMASGNAKHQNKGYTKSPNN